MNLHEFLKRREELRKNEVDTREICVQCRQPGFSCYCSFLRPFDPGVEFVILTHPIEMKRRIATGRMSHLNLKGSHWWIGHDFTHHEELNKLLDRGQTKFFVLYPGRDSKNLTRMTEQDRSEIFTGPEKVVILVIDGTWATARQMMNRSRNLQRIQKICFEPSTPSQFRVRKQPADHCYSTIEAIHHVLQHIHSRELSPSAKGKHEGLLSCFQSFVELQLELMRKPSNPRRLSGQSRRPVKSC